MTRTARQCKFQGAVQLLATDRQHSVIAQAGSGQPAALRAYTPYGQHGKPGLESGRPGFNGQFSEAQTGWQLLGNGHRAYNPTLMRFHSPDALSPFDKGGLNAYAYCNNDPVNRSDPDGRSGFMYFIAGFAVASSLITGVIGSQVVDEKHRTTFFILSGVNALMAGFALGSAGVMAYARRLGINSTTSVSQARAIGENLGQLANHAVRNWFSGRLGRVRYGNHPRGGVPGSDTPRLPGNASIRSPDIGGRQADPLPQPL